MPETGLLDGARIHGDEFDAGQLAEWYADEREAYVELVKSRGGPYAYGYHALNTLHGYRRLPAGQFSRVLGLGSSYGDEFLPLIARIDHITVVESSATYANTSIHGVPCTYVAACESGKLPLESDAFDLITSLGCLHHVPNVTALVHELARVLRPGGYLLVREPITSMGDWRRPRAGLTRRERGIPLACWKEVATRTGLSVERLALCMLPGLAKACDRLGLSAYNSMALARVDAALCRLLSRNVTYHRTLLREKIAPTSAFLVLRRPPLPASPVEQARATLSATVT
jgi:SAM-dependent methyltransferase